MVINYLLIELIIPDIPGKISALHYGRMTYFDPE